MGKIHLHSLGSVTEDLDELEGFGADHQQYLLLGFAYELRLPTCRCGAQAVANDLSIQARRSERIFLCKGYTGGPA